MTTGAFWDAVLIWCAKYQASVTSGFRTRQRNAAVGGHPQSRHLLGLAADVVYDLHPASEEDRKATAAQLGIRVVIEGDHDHLQSA